MYEANYVPFGPPHGESGSEEFRYTGKREDPSGLYYFGARYYDPETGRFITEDPVTGSLNDPQGLNRYVYCRNNPHKYVDSDGRLGHIAAGAIAGFFVNTIYYTVTRIESIGTGEFSKGIVKAAVTGTISGAITAATAGLVPSRASFFTEAALKYAGNTIASSVSSIVELGMDVGFGDVTRESFSRQIGHTTIEVSISNPVETLMDIGLSHADVGEFRTALITETAS
ncbi:MAG: RHS repeat-associated core domain-containing protein, partial [Candidatus Bathyarchaeota archaeon]|nr:RHS repeat-associated core domain-containing protein [Candidatus Bathyarchaeota archaeon]